ncbi:hypothetical protein ES5_00662 [Dietzia cinnamea P4]|nr:hypothetical protein ES5_00662 [Dietzia cinnamea P4]
MESISGAVPEGDRRPGPPLDPPPGPLPGPLPGPALGYQRSALPAHGCAPEGWREVVATAELGGGVAEFDALADDLLSLSAHRRSGLRITPTDRDSSVDVVILDGPMRGPCRLVDRIDESLRQGLVVGTLEGNTAVAEHRCHLDLDPDTSAVTATVRTVWRPRTFYVLPGATARETRAYGRMADRLLRALGAPRPDGA